LAHRLEIAQGVKPEQITHPDAPLEPRAHGPQRAGLIRVQNQQSSFDRRSVWRKNLQQGVVLLSFAGRAR